MVRRLHVAAEVGAVHLHGTGQGRVGRLGRHGLAELVAQHEGRLVLHVQVAAELQGAMAFGAVDEDRDGEKQGADGQLAAGEDGAGRDRELVLATPALPTLRGRELVGREATALRANRFALRLGPTDHAEAIVRLFVRKPGHPS